MTRADWQQHLKQCAKEYNEKKAKAKTVRAQPKRRLQGKQTVAPMKRQKAKSCWVKNVRIRNESFNSFLRHQKHRSCL